MQSKMAKTLLLLSSIGLSSMLSGCLGHCPAPVVVVSAPELVSPDYNTTKPFHIKGKKRDGKIILETKEFTRVTEKLIEQKYQIQTLQSIIAAGNSWQPSLLEGKPAEPSFFDRLKLK